MKKTIEIMVGTSGEIQINALHFQGSDCEKATRYLEEALGVVARREKKPEFSRNVHVQPQQKVGA